MVAILKTCGHFEKLAAILTTPMLLKVFHWILHSQKYITGHQDHSNWTILSKLVRKKSAFKVLIGSHFEKWRPFWKIVAIFSTWQLWKVFNWILHNQKHITSYQDHSIWTILSIFMGKISFQVPHWRPFWKMPAILTTRRLWKIFHWILHSQKHITRH